MLNSADFKTAIDNMLRRKKERKKEYIVVKCC